MHCCEIEIRSCSSSALYFTEICFSLQIFSRGTYLFNTVQVLPTLPTHLPNVNFLNLCFAMNAPVPQTYLAKLAENTFFVLGAYFFAFFPWAVMHNIDFISDKWRTVKRTRRHAYRHLFSSVVPCIYVAVYAEAQRQNNDSQELGAAIAALMFNLIHFWRTLMGIVQLDAFVAWCKHATECVEALLGHDDESGSDGNEREDAKSGDMHENQVRVNNSVVDNEIGGTAVTVRPAWKKMWDGLKKGEFKPTKWLQADFTGLCTVRWCAAYLCGIGRKWNVGVYEAREQLEHFFSGEMSDALRVLQRVTWNASENNHNDNENSGVICVKWLGDELDCVELSGEATTAFGNRIIGYYVDDTWTVISYKPPIDSLISSYPVDSPDLEDGSHPEDLTVGLVHSVLLAKYLGVEKLTEIQRYYRRHRMHEGVIFKKAMELFLKQTCVGASNESKIFKLFCNDSGHVVPLFPYRMQLVALWEQETNQRVLQASAHADIQSSLQKIPFELTPLHKTDIKPHNVFDYCSSIARNAYRKCDYPGCVGTVIESVRSFLAEWRTRTAQEIDWEPAVPVECFEFNAPSNFSCKRPNREEYDKNHYEDLEYCVFDPELKKRTVWVSQQALQREVTRISKEHQNLPSNNALVMLFFLGFPILEMSEIEESEVEAGDNNAEVCKGNGSASQSHHVVNLSGESNRAWSVRSKLAPQDIWIEIRIDVDTKKCKIALKKESEVSRFVWQDWVEAAMGFMDGCSDRGGSKGGYERNIRSADLRDPIVELCPLLFEDEERVIKTSKVRVWMGWPPFDIHICKFEMEQWLNASNIDLAADHLIHDDSSREHERPCVDLDWAIEHAESVIEAVVFGEAEKVREEISEKTE